MIILDTHTWVWYAQGDPKLPPAFFDLLERSRSIGLGISTISLWEIALANHRGRIDLPVPLEEWFAKALAFPGLGLLEITPEIAIESTRLPGDFHKDPADRIIVATSRIRDCELMSFDAKILSYEHVKLAKP